MRVTDAAPQPELPERIALLLTWSRKRRSLTRRFGVLILQGSTLTLLDRDDSVLLTAATASVSASPEFKTKVALTGPGGETFYLVGLSAQEGRRSKLARALIERHGALAVPPNITSMSDRSWQRLIRSSSPYTAGTNQVSQHVVWRPLLLGLLWAKGAQGASDDAAGDDGGQT